MRGTKNIFKKWHPDPKLIPLLRPFFDRGFPAYVAADLVLRDNNGDVVKNPNVKTYFKYWKFWKEEALEKQRRKYFQIIKKRQKEFEIKYLTQYDKLILVAYEMEQTLENCRKFKQVGLFDYENYNAEIPHIDIDLKLETMIYRVTKLWSNILYSKYIAESDIILYKLNEKKMDRLLRKITTRTHSLLLRVVRYLSKRESRKAVLDCQMEEKTPESIVIRCGICAGVTISHIQNPRTQKNYTKRISL